MHTWLDYFQTAAALATALGVIFAGVQLLLTKRQATTQFEDSLAREYRQVAQRLPIGALLGETLSEEVATKALEHFYHYIDLTNEQVFLRVIGRVSKPVWDNWQAGIQTNLSRPAFKVAWEHVKARSPDSFAELRRLEREEFDSDPRRWR